VIAFSISKTLTFLLPLVSFERVQQGATPELAAALLEGL